MSAIYNPEPPTKGAVTLHTTHGPLDLRLWSADAPLAARNFVQHCLDGTYDGLPFHRIVPSLLVQTGDPSGTGDGGHAAISGPAAASAPQHEKQRKGGPHHKPLSAPRNARLRFRRRGLVAFVADQPARTFRSQFFVTLGPADWLDPEGHPIFAYVFGDTVYNLLNLAAHGPVLDPAAPSVPRVRAATVVVSPFRDLPAAPATPAAPAAASPGEPAADGAAAAPAASEKDPGREAAKQNSMSVSARAGANQAKETRKVAARSDRLLSFRDDGDDDDDASQSSDDERQQRGRLGSRARGGPVSVGQHPLRRMRPVGAKHPRPRAQSLAARRSAEKQDVAAKDGETTTQAPALRADVARKADDEFERLKAEMLGLSTPAPPAGGPNAAGAASPATAAAVASSSTAAKAATSSAAPTAADRPTMSESLHHHHGGVQSSELKSNARQYSAGELRAKKRRGVDEAATLARLKTFEGRILSGRQKSTKGNGERKGAAWFGSALRLPKAMDDITEYDVVEGPPPPTGSVRKKPR